MPGYKLGVSDLTFDFVMREWPETVSVFLARRMMCVGCLINPFHTVSEACREYRVEEAVFRRELERSVAMSSGRGG